MGYARFGPCVVGDEQVAAAKEIYLILVNMAKPPPYGPSLRGAERRGNP